jgi:hypothetical protein
MGLSRWIPMEVKDLPPEVAERYRKSDRDWRIEKLDRTDDQKEVRFIFEDQTRHSWFRSPEQGWILLEAPPETNI